MMNNYKKIPSRLYAINIRLNYEKNIICDNLFLNIPDNQFTVIIGPNGCGKSTLLKSFCRLLPPTQGNIYLDGHDIHHLSTKEIARQIGLLPQSAQAPEGIRVIDLVARGRYPHQKIFQQWSHDDERAVKSALEMTGTLSFAEKTVDELSGGQRQRVWIAMVLAQETPILLLDEPTTYLDITHQVELLKLFQHLNRQSGRTLIVVLHDINQACRYADYLVVMKKGKILAQGSPNTLITKKLIKEVFDLDCIIIEDPVSKTPLIIPK